MDEKITLTKVNIVGEKFFHVFEMEDGSIQQIETTKEDYKQLGTPEHIDPTIENGRWLRSYIRPKYNTVDGNIHEKEYVDDGQKLYLIVDGNELYAKREEVVDDKIETLIVNDAITKMVELQSKLTIQ